MAEHVELSQVLQAKGDLAGAIAATRSALALDPQLVIGHVNLGLFLEQSGEPAAAIESYGAAIRLAELGDGPPRVTAHSRRGALLADRGDAAALKDHEEAKLLAPGDWEVHEAAGSSCFKLGDPIAALDCYDRAIELNPERAVLYANRAAIRGALGQREAGMSDAQSALERDPTIAEAHYSLGLLHGLEPPRLELAIESYGACLALDPQHKRAYFNRAVDRTALGDTTGAEADYDAALKIDPRYAAAYVNRGALRLARGDRAGAVADCRAALDVAPPSWPHRASVEATLRQLETR